MKTEILSLFALLMIGCGTNHSIDSSAENLSKQSNNSGVPADVEGEFNGDKWRYLDGKAHTITHKGKKC